MLKLKNDLPEESCHLSEEKQAVNFSALSVDCQPNDVKTLLKAKAKVVCQGKRIDFLYCQGCSKPSLRFLIVISGKVANAVFRNKIRRWLKSLLFGSSSYLEAFSKASAYYAFIFKPAAKQLVLNDNGFSDIKLKLDQMVGKL